MMMVLLLLVVESLTRSPTTLSQPLQGVYTVSVQAVDGVGNVGPATSEVVRSSEY